MDTRVIDNGEGIVVANVQDVEPIVRAAHAARTAGLVGSSEMRHAAEFPSVIVEQYLATHKITFNEFLQNPEHAKRMLNDPALAAFRVWEGRA